MLPRKFSLVSPQPAPSPAALAHLRGLVERLEGRAPDLAPQPLVLLTEAEAETASSRVPRLLLAAHAVHEVEAASLRDQPAAFGFAVAIGALAQRARAGEVVIVMAERALRDLGEPYGRGLAQLGIDIGRLLLVRTRSDRDALWALEEIVRSRASAALVVGALARTPTLVQGRRLALAAGARASPLLLLSPPGGPGIGSAVTRWRVATMAAGKDRDGARAGARWEVQLVRCRRGPPGRWIMEWDHAAYRLRLVADMADRLLPATAFPKGRAAHVLQIDRVRKAG